MALIKCKECGHMISEKALACPKCGCSVEKGNILLEEQGNTNKNSSTPSKSVGKKRSTSDILWIVIPLFLIIVAVAFFMYVPVSVGSSSSDSDSSTTEASSTIEASYGPGTYEFVDEAGQQWQLFIGIEEVGDASNYTLKEENRVIFTKLSTGKEYKGEWEGWRGVPYNEMHTYSGQAPDIIFQRMPESCYRYVLKDGYLYINYPYPFDKDHKEFNFQEALKQNAPEIRLPVKKIK